MQGTSQFFRILLLAAVTVALTGSPVTRFSKLYAEDPKTFYILSKKDMIDILEGHIKGFEEIEWHKDGTMGSFKKEAISDLVELSTDKDGRKIVKLIGKDAEINEMRIGANMKPLVMTDIDSLGTQTLNYTFQVNGNPYAFSYEYPRGHFDRDDFKAKLRAYLLDHGFKIDSDGNITDPSGKSIGTLDAFITSYFPYGPLVNDQSNRKDGRGQRSSSDKDSKNSIGDTGPTPDDGLTPFERGLRKGRGNLNIRTTGGQGGILLPGSGQFDINGLNGLKNLVITLNGMGLDPRGLFAQMSADPELAKILAGMKDGSKSKQDLMDYLRAKYNIQDANALSQLADLLGSGLNLSIFAGGGAGSSLNLNGNFDLASLLASLGYGNGGSTKINIGGGAAGNPNDFWNYLLNGGAGGKLNINGNPSDLAGLLAALGYGNGGSAKINIGGPSDLSALLASLGLDGGAGFNFNNGGLDLGNLGTLFLNAGVDPSLLPTLIQLALSGAPDADIRKALLDAKVDPSKIDELMNALSKFKNASKTMTMPGGGAMQASASFGGGGAFSFTEIPETGELQVRNPDGSYDYFKIENRNGKKVAVDAQGKVVFEFNNGWQKVGGAMPSMKGPMSEVNLDPSMKFLIDAGISPSLIQVVLPSSGNIRGVWGDTNGRFWMAGYQSPVSIDAQMKDRNNEEFEKLNLQK